jgi:hypothetical protein
MPPCVAWGAALFVWVLQEPRSATISGLHPTIVKQIKRMEMSSMEFSCSMIDRIGVEKIQSNLRGGRRGIAA